MCRRLDELNGMGGCPIAIFVMMRPHISNCAVLCLVSCIVFSLNGDEKSRGKICSLVKETAPRKFDMKEEVMLTVLTRLELGEVYLHLLPALNVTCTLNFHNTSPALLAANDVVVAAILKK
ncbi:hypothetical protein EV1_011839 [Malus domestica]